MEVDLDASKRAAELEADRQELKCMLGLSKRPNVAKALQDVLDKVERELAAPQGSGASASAPAAAPNATPTVPAAAPAEPVRAKPVVEEKPHVPVQTVVKSAGPWTEVTTFALDLGGYDKPDVTVDARLKGVELLPGDNVTCEFTEASFDLKIVGLDGANYRMLKTNLDKDIIPADSSVKVKKNHVVVTLKKVKGQYGYDSWSDLCAKGGKRKEKAAAGKKDDPQDSIMSMMKDLYDDGDDNMKKIIGEAMYKSKRGEKMDNKDLAGGADDKMMPDLGDDF